MNASHAQSGMVGRLIRKDWYFHRWAILAYIGAGALALTLVGIGGEGAFYIGSTLLITVLISVGIHLPMATVVEERKNQTLPFVMSLPISASEYTLAKVVANLLIILVPWLTLLVGTVVVIASRETAPDGLIPFAIILMVEILAGSCLILAVALVSESMGWSIAAIVFGNLFFQGFLYYVAHIPSVASAIEGPSAVWNRAEVTLLAAELAAIALILGLTFFLQSRKTDFI